MRAVNVMNGTERMNDRSISKSRPTNHLDRRQNFGLNEMSRARAILRRKAYQQIRRLYLCLPSMKRRFAVTSVASRGCGGDEGCGWAKVDHRPG